MMLGVGAALGACNHYGGVRTAVYGRGPKRGPKRGRGHGPPPHAPAHGYRHKQRGGAELVYDTGIGVYLVAGLADHYFGDGRYYRYLDGAWTISVAVGGPWNRVQIDAVPPGLRKKYRGRGKRKGRGKGKGKRGN